ncbi:hypothetical protein FRC10_005506 [Ceratobasidium sp. 414]|nr:hypothetical protein FRC10_005506 [Ceratobasidium sp. 414]
MASLSALIILGFDLMIRQSYPPAADPPLSVEDIKQQSRERLHWGFAYAVSSLEWMNEEDDRQPDAYTDLRVLATAWTRYQKQVVAKLGLPPKSWRPYRLPDRKLVNLLVLGVGFGQVLHRPLKAGIIEAAREELGTTETPKWYLFDEQRPANGLARAVLIKEEAYIQELDGNVLYIKATALITHWE